MSDRERTPDADEHLSATTPSGDRRAAGPGGPLFWATGAIGTTTVVVALAKLRAESSPTGLTSAMQYLLGAGVAHDALWAPVVVLCGLVTLAVPTWARVPVRIGLAFTALTALFAWPEVRGYGARARNPSMLPLDYGRNQAVILALVWIGVSVAIIVRAGRRRIER